MANANNSTPFLPSVDDWARMYARWADGMAKSLWSFGSYDECLEAVHEAFLKAMGLSDRLHLRDELLPRDEWRWYGFLKNQAKGILSHRHSCARRFVPIREYALSEETLDEEDWGDVDDSKALVARPVPCGRDRGWLKDEVRRLVKKVCRESGLKERNIRAFELFVLDEQDGEKVVALFPDIGNANNLYQIKKRIMNLLVASSGRFEEVFDELKAA